MIGTSGRNDVSVVPHPGIMHYALSDGKRLLRYSRSYLDRMDTPNARLKKAREDAGYLTAVEAADAMNVARSTYLGHENGHRGFPAGRAPQYSRKFKTTPEWLLYGREGDEAAPEATLTLMLPVALPNAAALTAMFGGLLDAAGRSDLAAELAPQLAQRFPAALERSIGPRSPQASDAVKAPSASPRQHATDRRERP